MTYRHRPIVRTILERLVEVVCPPEAIALGLTNAIVDHVGLTMSALPAPFRSGLVAGLLTYDLSAVAWPPGRGRRAHTLPTELGERWLARWEHGPTPVEREFAKAVGQLIKLACYEQPAMQARIGYTPAAWIDQVARRRLEVYAPEVRRADADILTPDPLRPLVARMEKRACRS